MKRIFITFLSLLTISATSSAQNNACSQKLETLGGLIAIEAKIQRLIGRDLVQHKLAEARIELGAFYEQRQLNKAFKFKDYFGEFRKDCGAIQIACQSQINAYLTAQQKVGQNSGAFAEAQVIDKDYAGLENPIAVSRERETIRGLLESAQVCMSR